MRNANAAETQRITSVSDEDNSALCIEDRLSSFLIRRVEVFGSSPTRFTVS